MIVFPLAVTGTRDDVLKAAVDLRDELKVGEVTDGVQPYIVGQQALWAGMQELQQEDLEKAESTGFPLDPDRPARGLRLGRWRRCCPSASASRP